MSKDKFMIAMMIAINTVIGFVLVEVFILGIQQYIAGNDTINLIRSGIGIIAIGMAYYTLAVEYNKLN